MPLLRQLNVEPGRSSFVLQVHIIANNADHFSEHVVNITTDAKALYTYENYARSSFLNTKLTFDLHREAEDKPWLLDVRFHGPDEISFNVILVSKVSL